MENLPANQKNGCELSLAEQRTSHREWIGGRAITLLNHYWRDDDPAEMTGALGKDWADVLEGLPQEAIQKACVQYQRNEPRRKPTPGAIYDLARTFIPRPSVVQQPDVADERVPCDPATAQAICEAAGFAPKKFGGAE